MVVGFSIEKSPSYRVASVTYRGAWREDRLRASFREIAAWAKKHRVATGHWILLEGAERGWTACIEIKGSAKASGKVRIRTLPAATVASSRFDPEVVAPYVIYHGLMDWLRWRRKEGKIRRVLSSREIYLDDPWTNPKAWARTEVQFVVKR